jgi:hypothetical protein
MSGLYIILCRGVVINIGVPLIMSFLRQLTTVMAKIGAGFSMIITFFVTILSG